MYNYINWYIRICSEGSDLQRMCMCTYVFYSGNGRYITVYYLDANATVLAVRSLTYTYNSTNLPEPVFNTSK